MVYQKLKQGFQEVNLGGQIDVQIPFGWTVSTLENISNNGTQNGLAIRTSDYGKGIPIVGMTKFYASEVLTNENMKEVQINKKHEKLFSLKSFDLLFGRRSMDGKATGEAGKCIIVSEIKTPIIFESSIIRMSVKPEYNPFFIYQLFKSNLGKRIRIRIIRVSAVSGISSRDLKGLKIPLPSKREQDKITSILSNVDSLISSYNETISQTKRLKQGLVHQLLTKGIGHKKFKNSKLGSIPEDWTVTRLESVAKLRGGCAFKSEDYVESGIQLLKIANVSHGKIIWDEQSFVPNEYYEKYTDFQIKHGDIILAMTRPIISGGLKISIFTETERTLLNQRVGKFNIDHMNSDFFYHLLNHRYFFNQISSRLSESNQPNISSNDIEKIWISYPSKIEEQQKIATILSKIDSKLFDLNSKKNNLEHLKRGLMQKLLTGQIRVTI